MLWNRRSHGLPFELRLGPRRALPAFRGLRTGRPHRPRHRCSGCRGPHAGGLHDLAPQGMSILRRADGTSLALRDRASAREQRPAKSTTGGSAQRRLGTQRSAECGSGRAATGGGRGGRRVRTHAPWPCARRLSTERSRGAFRSRDREVSGSGAQHDLLAHPSGSPTLRSFARGRGGSARPRHHDVHGALRGGGGR